VELNAGLIEGEGEFLDVTVVDWVSLSLRLSETSDRGGSNLPMPSLSCRKGTKALLGILGRFACKEVLRDLTV
jgi:hypothetical protein